VVVDLQAGRLAARVARPVLSPKPLSQTADNIFSRPERNAESFAQSPVAWKKVRL
jgi:hypothetical protein